MGRNFRINLLCFFGFVLLLVLTFLVLFYVENTLKKIPYLTVKKVWSDGNHNAFPSIIKYKEDLLLTFRTSSGHMKDDGSITIVKKNFLNDEWNTIESISMAGKDARDPKLSTLPNGKLLLLFSAHTWEGNSIKETDTFYSIGIKGIFSYKFSEPKPVTYNFVSNFESNRKWLWDVAWNSNFGYGVLYTPASNEAILMSSENGVVWNELGRLLTKSGDQINEASVVFQGVKLVGVITNNAGNGYYFESEPPYVKYKLKQINHPLGGPNLIELEGSMLLLTRFWDKQPHRYTALGKLENFNFIPQFRLPSYGDTGYGDLLVDGDSMLVVYCSTGQIEENISSDIFLAKIPLDDIYEK